LDIVKACLYGGLTHTVPTSSGFRR
jgi:hypothetical protein